MRAAAPAHAQEEAHDLYRRIREELYRAKVLVRSSRNHTKTTAAALQDSEERLDDLLEELELRYPIPTPEGGPGTNGKAAEHPPHE
jgi:hypothetical protein